MCKYEYVLMGFSLSSLFFYFILLIPTVAVFTLVFGCRVVGDFPTFTSRRRAHLHYTSHYYESVLTVSANTGDKTSPKCYKAFENNHQNDDIYAVEVDTSRLILTASPGKSKQHSKVKTNIALWLLKTSFTWLKQHCVYRYSAGDC